MNKKITKFNIYNKKIKSKKQIKRSKDTENNKNLFKKTLW